MIAPDRLARIARLVCEENARRRRRGGKPLYLLYDQVYWRLLSDPCRHTTPATLVPEVAPYTILVDAASKGLAATGLRVGWALVPSTLRPAMTSLLGHVGAWAPTAEQVATAEILSRPLALERHRRRMTAALGRRLGRLARTVTSARDERQGVAIEVLPPPGGLYLAVRVRRPGWSDERVRQALLAEGVAVVPFSAFGMREGSGWFRLSVGVARPHELLQVGHALRAALHARARLTSLA